jgi:hypothetical protein
MQKHGQLSLKAIRSSTSACRRDLASGTTAASPTQFPGLFRFANAKHSIRSVHKTIISFCAWNTIAYYISYSHHILREKEREESDIRWRCCGCVLTRLSAAAPPPGLRPPSEPSPAADDEADGRTSRISPKLKTPFAAPCRTRNEREKHGHKNHQKCRLTLTLQVTDDVALPSDRTTPPVVWACLLR